MAISAIAGLASVGSAMIAAGTFAIGMTTALTAFAVGMGLSAVSRALMPKPDNVSLSGITENVRSSISPKKIIYGQTRVGGTIVMMGSADSNSTGARPTDVNDNKYLTIALAVAGHIVDDFKEVYFNDEKVWDDSSPGGNYIDDWGTHAKISFLYGAGGYNELLDSGILGYTNEHEMKGNAILVVRLRYDQEVYTQGIPKITCVVKGRKVHDPRGNSQKNWSSNPALILLDYLTDKKYGLGETYTNIDLASFRDAADVCDELVQLKDGSTQNRYRCHGVLDTAQTMKNNIESILSSMIGTLTLVGGKYVCTAYEYRTPSLDIDESVLIDNIVVKTKQSKRNTYNGVKGTYISSENNYTPTDYPAQVSQLYADLDGQEILLDMTLPMTNNNVMAQRIARLTMFKSRLQTTVQMTLNLTGLKVKVGDNIRLTNKRLGYNNKIFQVINYSLVPDASKGLAVSITAIENDSRAYNWDTNDEIDFTTGGEVALYDGKTANPVKNLTVEAFSDIGEDGSIMPAINVSWTNPDDAFTDRYEIRYKNTTNYPVFYYMTALESPVVITPVPVNSDFEVKVYAINERGVKSSPETATVTTTADFQPKVPSVYRIEKTDNTAPTLEEFTAAAGRSKKDKDIVITKNTSVTPNTVNAWTYDAVTGAWVADNNFFTGDLIIDGSIQTNQLADGSITYAKISSIDADTITTGTLNADRIELDGVTLDTNDDGELTISNGGITELQLSTGAVTSDTIADLSILDTKLAAEAVTNAKIAVDAIQANVIKAGSITGVEIEDDAISAEKIAANTITASEIEAGSITATEIQAKSITAAEIASDSITTDVIAANAITANEILSGSITADEIAADSITGDRITADSITGEKIAADTIQVNQLTGDVGEVYPFMFSDNNGIGSTPTYSDEFTLQAPDLIEKTPKITAKVEYAGQGATTVQMKAKSTTAFLLAGSGAVTVSAMSGFFQYSQILTIGGDQTKKIDYTGAVSDAANAANGVANIIGIRYDSTNNKTILTVRATFNLFSQGDDVYYHKYKWVSAGTFVDVIDPTDLVFEDTEYFQIMLPKTNTETVFRLKYEAPNSGVHIVRRVFGTLEYVS